MSTHVGTFTSTMEVQPEPGEQDGQGAPQVTPSPDELDRTQAALARLGRDALRTKARGFDD